MTGESYSANWISGDAAWREIETLVDELAKLTRQDVSAEQFHAELVARAVSGLAASGGALWVRGSDSQLQLLHQVNLPRGPLTEGSANRRRHDHLIQHVMGNGQPALVPPGAAAVDDEEAVNPTDHLLLLCPVNWEPGGGLIEIFQRGDSPPEAQQGYLRFLAALAELAAEFQTNLQLRLLRRRAAVWQRLADFGQRVHASLNVRRTAYVFANEGRELAGADRLSVVLAHGAGYRLAAISGLDSFDRRANQVRRLEQLATTVARIGEPLWYDGDANPLSPEMAAAVEAFLDQSHARLLAVIPLRAGEHSAATNSDAMSREATDFGVAIVERFEAGRIDEEFQDSVREVCRHGTSALCNAVKYERLPLRPVWRWLEGIGWLTRARQLPKTITAALIAIVLLAGLIVIPADFNVTGSGQLQPRLRRDIFAESDGVVNEIRRVHGEEVSEGQVVVVLRQGELDLDAARISGELQTARTQLATVRATRMGTNPSGAEQRARYNQLVAEEEELRARLTGLEAQQQVVRDRRATLEVRSPIAGQVMTWDVQQLLEARPVRRGDILMRVADLGGPWELLISVPDRQIGHVLAARRESDEKLAVSFVLATEPEVSYSGRVEHVAMATQIDEGGEPTVQVRVSIERDAIPLTRPGASVIAKIDCGRRSIGYLWFHDLIDQVRTHLFF